MGNKKPEDFTPLVNRIMSGEDGKKFEQLLKSICYIGQDVFSQDSNTMSYQVGRQSVYILLDKIKNSRRNDGR